MQVAIKRSILKKPGEVIHAACIYSGKRMLSIGWNSSYTISCGMQSSSRHAEAMAIEQLFTKRVASMAAHLHRTNTKICYRGRRNLTIMVIRIDSTGKLRNSKCCSECIKLLRSFSIRTAIWSCENGTLTSARVDSIKPDFVSSGNRAWKR